MSLLLIQASASHLPIADEAVQCVVTSPPYWGLRQYAGEQREVWGGEPGHAHEWGEVQPAHHPGQVPDGKWAKDEIVAIGQNAGSGQFCACGAWYGALGLEPTPELYVEHMVAIFREVRRVLRRDGTLWLNLGDSYQAAKGNPGPNASDPKQAARRGWTRPNDWPIPGLKPKDLVGIPWMVAFALRADGWWLRSDIIWHKPNPMPESVTDRPTKSHEYLFLLTKSERYYYDADAIREPIVRQWDESNGGSWAHTERQPKESKAGNHSGDYPLPNPAGRNKRTVWTIPTRPYPGAHFATYPEDLVEPCILAGTSPKACGVCGAPWERVTELTPEYEAFKDSQGWQDGNDQPRLGMQVKRQAKQAHPQTVPPKNVTTGWRSTCEHKDDSGACVVLDPFNGSGTTGRVAIRHGRSYVGVDISAEYLTEQARQRIDNIQHVMGLDAAG